MNSGHRNNHYVPMWYQEQFLSVKAKSNELFYLDLKPGTFTDPRGVIHQRRALVKKGPKHCFVQEDLYTTAYGNFESTDIERLFFGEIDSKGRNSVIGLKDFDPRKWHAFQDAILYLSTQKLRTPKGLRWLSEQLKANEKNEILEWMVEYRQLFCAIWTESIWLIADASESETKLIVSDHPVTVYNRQCGPRSQWCRDYRDPDIRFNGTHTIFPLSADKVLILTNLSWARNPYQSAIDQRPNPDLFRDAIFKLTDIQSLRMLTEQEVREINFIIKSRAWRYIAAGEEDWLYPEKYVSKSEWSNFGQGYLLMPDPRSMSFTTEILMGFKGGGATGFDEYGRRPWDKDYRKSSNDRATFDRFQGQFARLFGPSRRGRTWQFGRWDPETDSDGYHLHHLNLEKRLKKEGV